LAIQFFGVREELRQVVSRIYVHESSEFDNVNSSWLIVPDGEIKLIFPFYGSISCAIGETERLHQPARIIISGMRTIPGYLGFPTGVGAVGVVLKPEGAYRLLNAPMDLLKNRTMEGEELLGAKARRWQEVWLNLSRQVDRVDAIQSALVDLQRGRTRREWQFEQAIRQVKSSEGRVKIEDLAREVGWSRRQLDRRFHELIGVGPKNLSRVLRFHAVYKRLRRVNEANHQLDRVIYEYYYDQSHFLKEFKLFAGSVPRAYRCHSDYGRLYIPD
jgi:AraC-like DNA-binding protein